MTEAQINPLQTILDEFKTLSPETEDALIFNAECQKVASIGPTTEAQTKKLMTNFYTISQHAETIGGINNLIIQTVDGQLTITAMSNLYLATVSSRAAKPEVVKSLTQVIVPSIAKLLNQNVNVPKETPLTPSIELEEKLEENAAGTVLPTVEEPSLEPVSEPKTQFEPLPPSIPISQFMVEKIGGLLVAPDTVRIDSEVMHKWSDLFDGKQILTVNIEGLDGKKTTCKVKPIKDAKNNSKGIIQIPEKILQNLQTEKGKLVMVGPAIE